jgi:diaminopimelate decarboxylase
MDIVGPICESGDYFAKNREMPPLLAGDLLAVHSAGAYGAVMASFYNSRPIIPEIMVKGDKFSIVRKRITVEDMVNFENFPDWAT